MNVPSFYLAHEQEYQSVVLQFLAHDLSAEEFIDRYFPLWKFDRDAQWNYIDGGGAVAADESELCTVLDRIFTACDSYDDAGGAHTITETELRDEVAQLAEQRWPTATI